jgi:hypothetical protein
MLQTGSAPSCGFLHALPSAVWAQLSVSPTNRTQHDHQGTSGMASVDGKMPKMGICPLGHAADKSLPPSTCATGEVKKWGILPTASAQ